MVKFQLLYFVFTSCLQQIQATDVNSLLDKLTADGPFTCNATGSAISTDCTNFVAYETQFIAEYLKSKNGTDLGLLMTRGIASSYFIIPDNISVSLSSQVCLTPNGDGTTRAKFRITIDNLAIRFDYGINQTITGLLDLLDYLQRTINSNMATGRPTCANTPAVTNNTPAFQDILSYCFKKDLLMSVYNVNFTGFFQYMLSNVQIELSYTAPANSSEDWSFNYNILILMSQIQVFNKICKGSKMFLNVCNCLLDNQAFINLDYEMLNSMFSCSPDGIHLYRCPKF